MPKTTQFTLSTDPSTGGFVAAIDEVLASGAQSILILATVADGWEPSMVDQILKDVRVPVFGGVFPSIIFDGKCLHSGSLFVGFDQALNVMVINDLSQGEATCIKQLNLLRSGIFQSQSLITIIDGLAKNIERFVESLYRITGLGFPVVGGGAGSLDFIQKPCLFTNNGMLTDAALLIGINTKPAFAVNHGWEVLDGPYLVTGSEGNRLDTLNYAPAFEVYREKIEENSKLKFTDHEFFYIAKTYPLGIESVDGEILVRDPIKLQDQSLVCVGEVPQNSTVYLLKGEPENLIRSAGEAAKSAWNSRLKNNNNQELTYTAILFDCISRCLFLEGEFEKELTEIEKNLGEGGTIFGSLSLGEICTSSSGPVELLNKSTIISVY